MDLCGKGTVLNHPLCIYIIPFIQRTLILLPKPKNHFDNYDSPVCVPFAYYLLLSIFFCTFLFTWHFSICMLKSKTFFFSSFTCAPQGLCKIVKIQRNVLFQWVCRGFRKYINIS